MKSRKFNLGHRCPVTVFVLLFGVFAPIGCAQTPKNLFSKVWGPDRITFKEAVGLGDSRSKKRTDSIFADKLGNKSKTKRSSKLANNDSKSIGQKIGNFGKVLFTSLNRKDKNDKSVKKIASATPQTGTRIGDSGLRNPGNTSAAETLRKNRIRNNLKTKKNPTQSPYASLPSGERNSPDKSSSNSFAEFLDAQNSNQSRLSVQSAKTKTQDNTLAQADNPFADLNDQSNQKTVNEPVKESSDSPSSNQFVTEFDDSFERIRREQIQFDDDDDDDDDDWDEIDELDEFDTTRDPWSLASSNPQKTGTFETTLNQDTNLSRNEMNRKSVDRLMLSAHSELAKGRIVDALNYAQHADKIAADEGVFFGPKEEHPGDLVESIRGKLELTPLQAEKLPATNIVIVPRNRKNTIQETGRSSRKPENTNPFADPEPSDKRFAALPRPPEKTASAESFDTLPTFDSLPTLDNSNQETFEPQFAETKRPSHSELQTVIVEVSDPFDGMIVESDSVPPRIPTQGVQEKIDIRTIIRSADAQTSKYRGPKTISQKVLNRLKSPPPPPVDIEKNLIPQKQRSRSWIKSNQNSFQEKKPTRVNSNRGARIITTKFQVPAELDNVWRPVETKKQEHVETAQLTVVDAEHAEERISVTVHSEQPVIATRDKFFQIGGSPGDKSPKAMSLADRGAETGYKAGSKISELRDRSLIIACIAMAGIIGIGIRRRYSLRLLWQKFASR